VPYRGLSPALTDLLGGQVQVVSASMASMAEATRGGTSGGHTCSESIPGGDLVYKTTEDASLPASEPEPFYEPQAFNELQADTLAHLINELRDEWRKDHAVRSPSCAGKSRRCSLCSVNHTVSNLKNADVIDLPDWRWRRDVA
jgi:hypothetical protein